jgi:hypothetical protein
MLLIWQYAIQNRYGAHLMDAPWADVVCVHPRPAHPLVELHHLLSLLEKPKQRRQP